MPGATFLMANAYAALAVVVADGVMTAGGSNPRLLNSATAAFKQTDVGKRVVVEGAGAAGADLDTFIVRRISATQVELAAPALTTVAGSDISYALGVYRLSDLIAQGDVDGNNYQVLYARRVQIQLSAQSPGGSLFIGGPYVSTSNAGIQMVAPSTDNFTSTEVPAVTTGDYLCSDIADQLVNIYWVDDINLHTPA